MIDSGASSIFDYILYKWLSFPVEQSSDNQTHPYCIALRDNYEFWRTNKESDDSGKILLIDKSSSIIQVSAHHLIISRLLILMALKSCNSLSDFL